MTKPFVMFTLLAATICLGLSESAPITVRSCGGGEGPNPLFDISSAIPSTFQQVNTQGSVEEFLYWEKSNTIVYRNNYNRLMSRDLTSQVQKNYTELRVPLSRIVDPSEKFIVAEQKACYLDASENHPNWYHFQTSYPVDRHLFWEKDGKTGQDILYSWGSNYDSSSHFQNLFVFRYGRGDTQSTTCRLQTKPGEHFYIGEGHSFPGVFLYRTGARRANGSSIVSFFEMRLVGEGEGQHCELYPLRGNVTVPGPVKGVYRYRDQNSTRYDAFIVNIDHPRDNMMWIWSGLVKSQCYLYNFNGRDPYVLLNAKVPLLTTWSVGEGIRGIFPHRKEMFRLFKGLITENLNEHDFWITHNGARLFVAAKTSSSSPKKIYYIGLPNVGEQR